MKEKYYITTAIAYTSGKPHIGNVYDPLFADCIARYKRLKGYDVVLQTGTDEHGIKIEEKAAAANISPKEFVDDISGQIRNMWDLLNVSYDKFVRTTDEQHVKVVQKIFKKMYDKGDIYKGEYKGLYCTPCESFWTLSQLDENGCCPDCHREVKEYSEEAYFFKLSNYQERLEKLFEEHPEFVLPESRRNEMINNFLKPGLQDLCVSRTSVKWGIPVDFDTNHVVYVWLDALTNYITNIGYDPDGSTDEFKKLWPADLQIVGKDIIRFHSIYWPAFLWSLDLELPKLIFAHPWVLQNNDKMSKSRGNVIYADDLVNEFGVDSVRYYLLKEIPYNNDGNITRDLFIEKINSDLANVLGNLVQRTISMGQKYFSGDVSNKLVNEEIDNDFINNVNNLEKIVDENINSMHLGDALGEIMKVLRQSNKYIDETMPWVLAKDDSKNDRLETVMYNLLESIRVCGNLLAPFMPETSEKIKYQLNNDNNSLTFVGDNNYHLNNPEPLFQRIVLK